MESNGKNYMEFNERAIAIYSLSPVLADKVIAEAKKSLHSKRHGAIILKGNKIVGKGHNQIRKHKLSSESNYKEALHAEIDALLDSKGVGKVLITARINKQGELRYGRPCSNCLYSIQRHSKINRIIYSTPLGGWVEERIDTWEYTKN